LAPQFGLVGEQAEFQVLVEDPGYEGERAVISIKLNGEIQARFPATVGNTISIPLEIERRGANTVELEVEAAPDELTEKNNVFITEISGIRDRLQVLLVTGEPHMGGRAWRNLLKSDPAIDLVQFTILTNPREKRRNASSREMSLIAFPTRQLFEEKLDEFDLIIFDQFKRRVASVRGGRASSIISPIYLQNIAEYVENGGALLVATGPPYATRASIFRTPLAAVLPARPTGETFDESFRPELNSKGRRHPITAGFVGNEAENWGPWYRIIESNIVSGDVLMEGPSAEPLLVIDRVGDGRVGMVMSDQAWLWSKGWQGGGPYSEIFRRLSHWLMGEPDLDAEKLSARSDGGKIEIEDLIGNVDANTSGGSIKVGNVEGDVDLHTSGGSIRTKNIKGEIDAHTSGGSIDVTFAQQPMNDASLTTSGGSIEATFPADVAIDIDASTSGGRVRSEFDVSGRVKKKSIRGQINGGGPEIELRTSGGSISIEKD
jgi:uncharacterized membrane protein